MSHPFPYRGTLPFRLSLLAVVLVLLVALPAAGGPLDDFYLEKFGMKPGAKTLAATPATAASPERGEDRCRTWLHHDLKRDWKLLEAETQKTLAKVLPSRPALTGAATFDSGGGHFRITYATSGPDAPPLADGNANSTPDWIETVASVFEEVYAAEVTAMGYDAAPTSGPRYEVYLQNVGETQGIYGYAENEPSPVSGNSFASYIVIDNDFSAAEFGNGYTALQALQITAAHEYNHAIQFGYNYFFEAWFAEATATWMEDEIFDSVNQLYLYVPNYMSNTTLSLDTAVSTSTGGGYGRWIFNRHLAEEHGPSVIRDIWERLKATPSNHADIPMLPLIDATLATRGSSLRASFLGFTKKVYGKSWTSHTNDSARLHPVSSAATYSTYPVSTQNVTLPRYSFSLYRFQPSLSPPSNLAVAVTRAAGIDTAGFLNSDSTTTEIAPDAGGSITVPGFNGAGVTNAALIVVNTSASDNLSASFTAGEAAAFALTVLKEGTGSGSINSTPAGIACATGSNSGCSASFLGGTNVSLTATASAGSTFGGWSGNCTGTGACTVSMDAPRSVTAAFTLQPPVRIAGTVPTYHATLQGAYDAAGTGAAIEMREGTLAGTLVAGRPVSVTMKGGLNTAFSAVSSQTSVDGSILVRGGTVRMNRVKVR